MENLLNPDKGLIIWTIVSFAVLVCFLLSKVAWKPLIAGARRIAKTVFARRSMTRPARVRSAEQLKTRLQQELAKAQDKAAGMIS